MWHRNDKRFASDIDKVAAVLTDGEGQPEMLHVHPFYWIESPESWEARQQVLALVQQDLQQALRRLLGYRKS